jgi:hypothetical protein
MSEGELLLRQNYRTRVLTLPSDLRECAQSAHTMREQCVLLWLVSQCLTHERRERQTSTQWPAQVNLVIAEQTRAEPTVRGKTHAIAATAVRVRHRCDHTDAP